VTVRLRGHHLLCILTYKGEGYSPAFVANLDRIAARLTAGEDVLLVDGPDDVCAPLLAPGSVGEERPHCDLDRVRDRDKRALEAVSALLSRALAAGERLTLEPETASRMRSAFETGEIRAACVGCEWSELCTSIADARFAATLLHGGSENAQP
jgi:uncharacterized protein